MRTKLKPLTVEAVKTPRPEHLQMTMFGSLQKCLYDMSKERAYVLSDRILNFLENENPDEIVIGMRRYVRKPTGQYAELISAMEELKIRIAEIMQSADEWRKKKKERRKKSR